MLPVKLVTLCKAAEPVDVEPILAVVPVVETLVALALVLPVDEAALPVSVPICIVALLEVESADAVDAMSVADADTAANFSWPAVMVTGM